MSNLSNLYNKLNHYKRLLNDKEISILVECIVSGYVRNETDKKTRIPNIIILCISQFYGKISKSDIINDPLWCQLIQMISKQLNTKIELSQIYSAKNDGFSADDFHLNSDNKGPTIILIKNSYNYIFGGYASISWGHLNGGPKNDKNAFLFQLFPNKKIILQKHNNNGNSAVWHAKSWMCCFGCGNDLFISGDCNINRHSGVHSNPPTYNFTGDQLVGTIYDINTSRYFKIINIETFAVKEA